MKVKGRIQNRVDGKYWYFEVYSESEDPFIVRIGALGGYLDSYALAKQAAEEFATKHNMTIEWEGE